MEWVTFVVLFTDIKKLMEILLNPNRLQNVKEKIIPEIKRRLNPNKQKRQGIKNLLYRGFIPSIAIDDRNYVSIKGSVLYLLNCSLSYNSSGYAVRSQEILSSIQKYGFQIYGVTRLGFPCDELGTDAYNIPQKEIIADVSYYRMLHENIIRYKVPLDYYMEKYLGSLLGLAMVKRPSIIHAASNFVVGSVGIKAARQLGIPCIYEVRGLWELTKRSREPMWAKTKEYAMHVSMEKETCQQADSVITISTPLKEYLVNSRGVAEEKITIVHNGVNTIKFSPAPRNLDLEGKLGLREKKIIGFIGSVTEYEGLDLLLQAAKIMFKSRDDFRIIIVGDGPHFSTIKNKVFKMKLENKILLIGRVPYHEVEKYYTLIDIAVFPRKGSLVCELVPPLKPFEAMAMGKCVIASNVGALAEIVQDGKTGLLFQKDNLKSLIEVLSEALDSPEKCRRLSKTGREWVIKERDWRNTTRSMVEVYKSFLD